MTVLVIAEHDNTSIKGATLNTISAALLCSNDVHLFVAGDQSSAASLDAKKISGVSKVLYAESKIFENGLAENVAAQVLSIASQYTHILFAATATGKNLAPRVAAKLDVAQISDVTRVISGDTYERPIYAGNAIATVQSTDPIKVVTVRTTGFDPVAAEGGSAEVQIMLVVNGVSCVKFVGSEIAKNDRPELTAAKVIVSGGRALSSSEKFMEV